MGRLGIYAFGVCLAGLPSLAHAATSGTLALRGIVTTQAIVRIANASPRVAIDLGQAIGGRAVLRLTQLANSAAGFTVSLSAESAVGHAAPKLLSEDGSALSYEVLLGGRSVDLSGGETLLTNVTRGSETDGEDLEIVAPRVSVAKTRRYQDRLVLVVKAR